MTTRHRVPLYRRILVILFVSATVLLATQAILVDNDAARSNIGLFAFAFAVAGYIFHRDYGRPR
jgi:Ca2+/Na+ antiporter